jgi:hypothetical protein
MPKRPWIALICCILLPAANSSAYTNSSNFALAGVLTKFCAGATTSAYIQFSDPYSIGAPDVVLHNIGAVPVYLAVGTGGASLTCTIPSGNTPGCFPLNPGDFVIADKQQADTVACITPTGTSTLAVTPTYGN